MYRSMHIECINNWTYSWANWCSISDYDDVDRFFC